MKLRCWTGPCFVHQIANACRAAGLEVVAGTESIIIKVNIDDVRYAKDFVLASLSKQHGTTFGLILEKL